VPGALPFNRKVKRSRPDNIISRALVLEMLNFIGNENNA